MQIFTKLIAVGTVATLLGGCMGKPDLLPHGERSDAENSAFITMKTPVFRYADQGFIHKELVFASVGLEQTSKGFIQKIKKPLEYNIRYSVSGKNILFRDTINNIVIKVRENR